MVARSRPSTRRPNLRGEPKSSDSTTPVIDDRVPPELPGALRSKRARISSISDSQRLTKRLKTGQNNALPKFKFPLRNRRLEDAPKTKPVTVTKPVLPSPLAAHTTPTSTTTHPTKPTTPISNIKTLQKNVTTNLAEFGVPQQEERRKLRSKDGGSRSKSELAMFFNNYEQMLSLEPPKPETLTPRTRITLIDDLPESSLISPNPRSDYDPFGANKPLHNAQIIDLTSVVGSIRQITHDPLQAEIYYKAHRKAERAEKSARNSERERAQHEKVQLDRLLEGLKGPDWLKVMGISGVTESEKRLYEPKRALFTKEVTALIKKFEDWKEEEKRQKEKKKQEIREAEEQEVDDGGEDAAEDADDEGHEDDEPPSTARHTSSRSVSNHNGVTDYTSHEVDALAARQLHQETTFTATGLRTKKSDVDAAAAAPSPPSPPPPPYQPFKSFYSKRHHRDAAVAGHRRSRTITAFGEPVPELDDHDFELPATILTEDAVRASSRRKRRQRRESSDDY